MDYYMYNTVKKEPIWGHYINYISGGPSLAQSP